MWAHWVPEIVIEDVSAGSVERDYHEKRTEYLAVGVKEYWIVDPQKRSMLALVRQGDSWTEQVIAGGGVYACSLLPAFELHLDDVFSVLDDD